MHTGLETPVPLSVPFPKEMPSRELKELISTWLSPAVSYLLSSETQEQLETTLLSTAAPPDPSVSGTKCCNEASFHGLTEVWFHCDSAVNFPFYFFIIIAESQKSKEIFKESLEFHSEFILYH